MPGEPIVLVLAETPGAEVTTVALTRPDGSVVQTPVAREGTKAHLKIDDTGEPGIYRVVLPGPAGGSAFVAVSSDPRENEPETLADAEAETLAKGWPMAFEPDAQSLDARLQFSSSGGPRPVWRWLILAALGGLCLEVFLTRSLVKSRGMTAPEEPGS